MAHLAPRRSYGVVQMKKKAILTIPKEVRMALRLSDEGEVFELIVEDGKIILEPKALVLSISLVRVLMNFIGRMIYIRGISPGIS